MDTTQQDELLDAVRSMVRQFAADRITPAVDALESGEMKPFPLIRELCAAMGMGEVATQLLESMERREANPKPAGEGGGRRKHAGDPALLPTVIGELSRVSPGFALSFGASLGLTGQSILVRGTAEQRRRWAAPLLAGEAIGAWGLTEPDSGSDAFAMKTVAREVDGGWVLNGSKTFITNAPDADVLVVYARVDRGEGEGARRPMAAFILDRKMQGISTSKPFHKMGMRGSPTGSIHLEDVKVGPEHLLGGKYEAGGRDAVLEMLFGERVALCAMGLGIIDESLARAIRYAKERVQFGQPIASYQAVQLKLAKMYAKGEIARALLEKAIRKVRAGEPDVAFFCAAKFTVSEAAVEVANDAIQVLGGNGYMQEYRVEGLARDAKLLEIGGGTSDIQLLAVARELLR